ncbi:hypothetical protein R3P38DRAFT_3522772 [Favolaschia claudopus]|uniref:XPG-I domain-containing protein n=1 Tax=Favolaschia claudopus TaxID=2862362 RepID=A0AAW0E6N0_9AGAR
MLDPTLRSPTEDSVDSATTNGVSGASSKLPLGQPQTKYAPRRDAGESRAVYEQRLTLVTRKAPLLEACKKLHLKANKSSNLEALRQELAKYWFSQASSCHLASSSHYHPAALSTANPNDVLNFYPPPDPIHFAPPPGLLPTVSHTARGEFRGAVPLFHINPAASAANSSRATAHSSTLNTARRNTATATPLTIPVPRPASPESRAPTPPPPTATTITRHARRTDAPAADDQPQTKYAPRRDAGESRAVYEQRLTLVTRKAFRVKRKQVDAACIVNPSYSVFVAHKNPEVCSMRAFAFYHHWIPDVLNLTEKLKVDWAWNKSWRQARVLHGPNSPNTPYSEQALYNLYCRAFQHANFNSRMKAHLPRHLLGYKQEAMNVDSADTAQLGWVRNVTYFDTYKPALPKHAILGAAGYKVDETYDPVWTHRDNLSGAFNYWQMIIDMRPYSFQSGAAIYQSCPKSALFRLPAFQNEDVINWMKTTFPEELSLLHAQAGDPADLLLVQNNVLRKALEDLYKICTSSDNKLVRLTALLERRTSALSLAQGFSTSSYYRNALAFSSSPSTPPRASSGTIRSSPIIIHFDIDQQETGTYEATDNDGATNLRAFVNTSPRSPDDLRVPTQVDLVLPPTEAFFKPGGPRGIVPPLFGQKSARWPDVFSLVQQPRFCWEVWDDQKTRTSNVQHWSRYREIPEWIEREAERRGVPPSTIVDELEEVEALRKAAKKASNQVDAATPSTASSPDPETATLGQPFEEDTTKRKRAPPESNLFLPLPPRRPSNLMGSPKLWQILDDAASNRSLLNLTTLDAFVVNNRRRRTFLLGVDISIKLRAIEAALKKAGVLHPGIPGQKLVLEKFFYFLCNLLLACVVPIFATDGPGRPSEKRGVRVITWPNWLIEQAKTMITAFGFYFYDAPGEAEAQLAWLNDQGYIDGVLTEDSDALIFGAQPHVEDLAMVYHMDSIENTASVSLDQAGLLLCALLLGGDYAAGVTGIGPATAQVLARQGFGQELVNIMTSYVGDERLQKLAIWRVTLRSELRTNSSGQLAKRLPGAADNVSENFPNLDVVNLYLHPFICTSLEFAGPMPDCSSWRPRDPAIPLIADCCTSAFGWEGDLLLKKLNSNVFPGVTFRMISSPPVLYDKINDLFASPGIGGAVLTIRDALPTYADNVDLAPLDLKRVRISADRYVDCPQLSGLPALSTTEIKLVSIPKVILAVAMRDTALEETNLIHIPGGVAEYDESVELEVLDSDEEELLAAHSKLAGQRVIDLTGDD